MGEEKRAYVPELAGLDLLRFLLSITVILVHYFFFYYAPGATEGPVPSEPYFNILKPIYRYGGNVVQIFWLLSGFIFHTIYFQQIASRKVSFKDYMVLRLSRLYPLHLLTLLIVTVLQYFYYQSYHNWFWFDTEDVKHFLLQLFFVSAWYPGFEHSFNVPIWSVSLEFFVYIVFFIVTAAGLISKRNLYVAVLASLLFSFFRILDPFSRCLFFFFSGCIIAEHVREGAQITRLFRTTALVWLAMAVIFFVIKKTQPGLDHYGTQVLIDALLLPAGCMCILFFIGAFKRIRSPWLVKVFKQLGDLTYSTYLVHFPVILSMILIMHPDNAHVFDRPMMLFIFLTVSIVVGWVVFQYFEKPVQSYLRKAYKEKRKRATQTTTEATALNSTHTMVPPSA